jgi:hypothetical protein
VDAEFLCDKAVMFREKIIEKEYIYRVSQEECARHRDGVPYVKVPDITQNTYVQS